VAVYETAERDEWSLKRPSSELTSIEDVRRVAAMKWQDVLSGAAVAIAAAAIGAAAQAQGRQGAAARSERVPDAGIVSGVPQGMFVSRSLLSGRAVCLLFLSGGRVTRAIPEGGLESFDWERHRAAHTRDSGRWEMRGSQLAIAWGDGGVHEGPLTVRPDGIEFYGKRYAKPVSVGPGAIVGRWEAARGTAISGGAGVVIASELVIETGGRYRWLGTTGGTVAGRAVASQQAMTGIVTIKGATIVFTPDAGAAASHTFLPVAGTPVTAFSIEANMFTRVQ
jgi:hypothetical protein